MYSSKERIQFKVCKWIDNDTFKELLEFSEYVGRRGGCSYFEIDPVKMWRSDLKMIDVYRKLSEIDGVDPEDLEKIHGLAVKESTVQIYLHDDGLLRIKSDMYLKPILSKLGIYLPYDRGERAYKAPAHLYRRLVELFQSQGLTVDDRINLLNKKIPRKISFLGKLRPYQEEALEAWKRNNRLGVIALPTGAGKTVVAIAGMVEASVYTLVVVYTKEHVKQWIDSIKRFTDADGLVGAYYGDEKRIAPITVTTYQTAFKKVKLFAPMFSLLVIDEAHHLPADKFRVIATRMPAPYRMGLSATIEREDGKHEEIFPLIGGIVYHSTPGELARKGYLAPYKIITVKVRLKGDEKERYEKLRREYQALARGRTFQEVLEAAKKGDPTAIEALRRHAEMRSIIQMSETKLREVEKLAKREAEKGNKVIIFTQYKKQAEEIAKRVNGVILHGDMDGRDRFRALERFKSMDKGILVVTTVGDEGLDIPDANVGILVSGTGSSRQFLQRLGRLLRPSPGKKSAVLYEVIVEGTSEEYQSRRRRRLR